MSAPPRIWVLIGSRKGDNNQVLALAEALGLPFETRTLHYNLLRALGGRILGRSLASLTPESRRWIAPPWPDLVLAIGRRSVPVARWIQRQSKGHTRLVRVGHPRISPRLFDLVITTRQYPVPPGDNVLLLPLAMSRYRSKPVASADERAWLSRLARPHLLMAIGGATKYWELPGETLAAAALRLADRASQRSGSLVVVASPRTDPAVLAAIEGALAGREHVHILRTDRLRFPVLLDDADEIFVTGDSVSMLSEAVLTGSPVGLVPITLSAKGERNLGRPEAMNGRRDLRRFWRYLQDEGMVGTLDAPLSRPVENPVQTAAQAVLALIGERGL